MAISVLAADSVDLSVVFGQRMGHARVTETIIEGLFEVLQILCVEVSVAVQDSPEARAVATRHRDYISRWSYECSPEIHRGLGQMYVADPRFTANIDRSRPGLAAYMSAAIAANAGG